MYPFFRVQKSIHDAKRQGPLAITGLHTCNQMCWPWDLDVFGELNNGRTLTLFDLGRFGLIERTGLSKVMRNRKWGAAVLGGSVRYRRRIRLFDRMELRSRLIAWDERFFYIEQSHTRLRDGTVLNHALLRTAITNKHGIVPTAEIMTELGVAEPSPALPDWAQAWVDADAQRPWPPIME